MKIVKTGKIVLCSCGHFGIKDFKLDFRGDRYPVSNWTFFKRIFRAKAKIVTCEAPCRNCRYKQREAKP